MRFKSLFFTLLMFAALAGSAWAGPYRNLSAKESLDLLKKNPAVFLLDVRTPAEYMEVRLDGARLIPIDQLTARLKEIPGDRPVLVYCAVGSRSSQVADYLARQGHTEIFNLSGGIWGWQLRGLPVLKGMP